MATWVNYLYPRERHAPLHILSGSPSTKGSKLLKVFLFSGSVAVSVSVSVPVSVSFSLSVSVSFSAFPLRGGVHSIVAWTEQPTTCRSSGPPTFCLGCDLYRGRARHLKLDSEDFQASEQKISKSNELEVGDSALFSYQLKRDLCCGFIWITWGISSARESRVGRLYGLISWRNLVGSQRWWQTFSGVQWSLPINCALSLKRLW